MQPVNIMGLEENFDQLCRHVFPDGLKAGLVTDKDGVVILKSNLNIYIFFYI